MRTASPFDMYYTHTHTHTHTHTIADEDSERDKAEGTISNTHTLALALALPPSLSLSLFPRPLSTPLLPPLRTYAHLSFLGLHFLSWAVRGIMGLAY